MQQKLVWPNWLTYLLLSLYSVVIIMPIIWMLFSALKTMRELFTSPFAPPSAPQWANFASAWNSGISRFLVNSLVITTVSVLLIVVFSGMAAYAFARLRFPARVPLYLLLIAGFAIPVHTTLVPMYRMLNAAKLLNTYPGMIGPYVGFGIPFSVLLLYAFFMQFPSEIEDAARIDGCGTWQMVVRIVLPLSLPALASVAIFQAVFLWNEFSLAIIVLSDNSMRTVPLGLTVFQGEWTTNWPSLLAAVSLGSIPMLVLFILLQKQFVNSLAGFSK